MANDSRLSIDDRLKKRLVQRQINANSLVSIAFGYLLIIGAMQFIAMLVGSSFKIQSALLVLPILAAIVFIYYGIISKGRTAAWSLGTGPWYSGTFLVLLTIFALLVVTAIWGKDIMPIFSITTMLP